MEAVPSSITSHRSDLAIVLICPDCKTVPPDLIERSSDGDVVCGSCGLVLGDRIVDTRSEWRTFESDGTAQDDPSRVGSGADPLLSDSQLGTTIASRAPKQGVHTRAGAGRDAGTEMNLSRVQEQSGHNRKTAALKAAFLRITQLCDSFSLPRTVQEAAKDVYRQVYGHRKLTGKSLDSIMAAAIFIGCRYNGVERTFREICSLTSVSKFEIGKTHKIVEKLLQAADASSSKPSPQNGLETLILRYCSSLGLSLSITKTAEKLYSTVRDEGTLSGRAPDSIAAAVVYMSTGLHNQELSVPKLSEMTGVSEMAIKSAYRVLESNRNRDVLIRSADVVGASGKLNKG